MCQRQVKYQSYLQDRIQSASRWSGNSLGAQQVLMSEWLTLSLIPGGKKIWNDALLQVRATSSSWMSPSQVERLAFGRAGEKVPFDFPWSEAKSKWGHRIP